MQRIVPMIAYEDAAAAIDWLSDAFGFSERREQRYVDENGTVTHAELERDGAVVMLATPNAEYRGPKRHREECEQARRWQDNPWVVDGLFVFEAHHARAVAAGATVIRPVGDSRRRDCGSTPPRIPRGTAGCSASGARPSTTPEAASTLRAMAGAYLVSLPGLTPYEGAWALQRSIAAAVIEGALPDTVLLLEHEPVVTLGRRTDEAAELHVPEGVEVDVVETNRGGKSTYHGPGQLVCYPILDLNRHGRDLRRYVRDLEETIIGTLAASALTGTRIDGLTGVWIPPRDGQGPRKIASIGVHASRWVTTHGYALNVDLDPAPFTDWITACGLDGAHFTTMARELSTPLRVEDVRPAAATAIADVFGLDVEELPVDGVEALVAQATAR